LDLCILSSTLYCSGPAEEETDFKDLSSTFWQIQSGSGFTRSYHVYEKTHPITFNADDNDATIVQDYHPIIYKNPNGPIFVTVGTGEANDNDMALYSLEDFQLKELVVSLEY